MNWSRLKRNHLAASFGALVILAAIVFGVVPQAIAADRPDIERVGVPTFGSRGVTRSTADIIFQQATRNSASPGLPRFMNEVEGPERDDLTPNPASPIVASVPSMPVDQLVYKPYQKGVPNNTFSPQTVSTNFIAATLSGVNPTGAFPPDCNGAVGPSQFVVAVNGRLVVFNKTTGVQDGSLTFDMDVFFTSVTTSGSFTSDPQVRYDRLTSRWLISIIDVATPNRWLLAVSDAASNGTITAGTVWTYYFFTPATLVGRGTALLDYPSLGIDSNALYMGGNFFNAAGTAYLGSDAFVIRKSSILSGGPIVVTAFTNVGTTAAGMYTPRGVDNIDPTSTEGYFIGVDEVSYGLLQMFRVSNPGGTPTLSAIIPITVPLTSQALTVPHLGNTGGTNGNLSSIDDRLYQAMMRNGQLWTAHNIKVDNTGVVATTQTRNASRWYQLNVPVGAGTPTVVQSGTVFTATGTNLTTELHYWFPSVAISGQGHAVMAMSQAGTNARANASTVGRLAGDPLGTMQTPVAVTASSTAYNPGSDPGAASGRRWGDYSSVNVDPLDDQSLWQVQMFCNATNSYGVQVTKLLSPPPATPNVLADVIAGQAGQTLTLTGLSITGSGFFDPGPNLASPARPFVHISATSSNGAATGTPPVITSITYVDPTHVDVTFNATSATPNVGAEKYTITVTNPDGQSANAAVVHVVAGTYNLVASAGAGGTISPSGTVVVNPGDNQTFTIAADACHDLGDLLVDGVSQGALASYTFTNVQANHTIAASFTVKTNTIAASAGAGGSISPSGSVSVNCGSNQTFTMTADPCFSISDVLVDGVSVGAVASYTFTNVTAPHTIAASFSGGLTAPATAAAASQVKLGNDTDGTTKITLTFTLPLVATTAEVWRKGFGGYPQYDDAGGSVPTVPGSYPPAGWTMTAVTTSGQADEPTTRDDWYYVVYAKDACSNVGPPSNLTGGTLGYHLGDVSDGMTPGQGDNSISTPDVSLMGAYYGMAGAGLTGVEYLDVGPTTDFTPNGRPTTDAVIDFEDLVIYAVNYTPHVSLVAKGRPVTASAKSAGSALDALRLDAPASIKAGDVFDVPVTLTGSGRLQALSIALRWDAGVVEPVGVSAGDLVSSEGGVVFSPGPGRADAALLGQGAGMTGEGVVATVRFRAVADGAPSVTIARATGRSSSNSDVAVALKAPVAGASVAGRTELFPVIPNPVRGSALVQYALSKRGPVNLAVYSVDGRRIKTLVGGTQEAGRFSVSWDGADEHGATMKSGMYFVRYEAAGQRVSRVLTVIR